MKKILLVLLFAFSLFAGESEEIGVPYFDRDQGSIDSAVLSSDAKSFYTLKDNYFIHWSLSPLKKLEQWELPLAPIKNVKNHRDVYLLNDETKALIISRDELILYNLQIKKIEKQVACKNYSQVLSGNLLYVARANREGDKVTNYPRLYIEIWKVPELTMEKSVDISIQQSANFEHNLLGVTSHETDPSEPFSSKREYEGDLISGESVLYYFVGLYKVAIIDKTSLVLKDIVLSRGGFAKTADGYLVTNRFVMKESDASIVLRFPDKYDRNPMNTFLDELDRSPWFAIGTLGSKATKRRFSNVGDLHLFYAGRAYGFYRKNTKSSLLQYEDELILMNDSERTFNFSSIDFKLLKMKTQNGYFVPMNDATFKKYNQPLQINAN